MIRCKDIAAMVGVSRQAVTAVLNNSRPNCVSREKRAEILKIAAEHNYRPDHAALALKTGKSGLIGVIMPPWENPYIAGLCMGFQHCLAVRNYTPVFAIDNNFNPVPGNLDQFLSLRVAGIITVAASLLPDNIDIPVVSYFHDDPRFDSVCPDPARDARLIVEYLKKCGHPNFGYLGLHNDKRIKYLAAEAVRYGLDFPVRWQSWQWGYDGRGEPDAFDQLLKQNKGKDLPTALVIHNDAMAFHAIPAIREHGYRIPEDFSLISHDDVSFCKAASPALTSISFGSPDEIAESLVGLLIKRMENPGKPRKKVLLKSELIKRESVLNLRNKQ